jgi:acylphosphatase
LSEVVRKHVWVSGRVQNVWFRDSCRREAMTQGVAGWVHNLADGRVEAVFEGPPAAVDALVAWCHEGPPRAKVNRVEVQDELPAGEHDFAMR